MIKNIECIEDKILLKAEKEGENKVYTISKNQFISYSPDKKISYTLDENDIKDLRFDGYYVMAVLEELNEIDNVDIITSIMQVYLRNYELSYVKNQIESILKQMC